MTAKKTPNVGERRTFTHNGVPFRITPALAGGYSVYAGDTFYRRVLKCNYFHVAVAGRRVDTALTLAAAKRRAKDLIDGGMR